MPSQAWGFAGDGQPPELWSFAAQPPQPAQDRSQLPWGAFYQACKAALKMRRAILANGDRNLEPTPPQEVIDVLPSLLLIREFYGCPGRAGAV